MKYRNHWWQVWRKRKPEKLIELRFPRGCAMVNKEYMRQIINDGHADFSDMERLLNHDYGNP